MNQLIHQTPVYNHSPGSAFQLWIKRHEHDHLADRRCSHPSHFNNSARVTHGQYEREEKLSFFSARRHLRQAKSLCSNATLLLTWANRGFLTRAERGESAFANRGFLSRAGVANLSLFATNRSTPQILMHTSAEIPMAC